MDRLIFPHCKLAYKSTKKQKWNTTIQTSGSGKSRSMSNQLYPQYTIETKVNRLTDEEARALDGFVARIRGAHIPFFWLDPEDQQETGVTLPQVTVGVYQLVMRRGSYMCPVDYADRITVYVDGAKQDASAFALMASGQLRFKQAPAASAKVTADYRYYWHVILVDDGIEIKHVFDDFNQTSSFKLQTYYE